VLRRTTSGSAGAGGAAGGGSGRADGAGRHRRHRGVPAARRLVIPGGGPGADGARADYRRGGGSPGGTGSPDSFTAERVGDPVEGLQDLTLEPHMLDTYVETAEMVEESGDPRVDGLDGLWNELGQATSVTSTDYRAERVLPEDVVEPGGSPAPAPVIGDEWWRRKDVL